MGLCSHKCSAFQGKTQEIGLLDHMVKNMYSLIRNAQDVLQYGCTILHFHKQRMRVPVTLCQSSSAFGGVSVLGCGLSYRCIVMFFAVLLYLRKTYDIEHYLTCLSTINVSSWINCVFKFFSFLNQVFLSLNFKI